MNILVIGNGFDLAHGLPTKYTDFLEFCKVIVEVYFADYNDSENLEERWNKLNIRKNIKLKYLFNNLYNNRVIGEFKPPQDVLSYYVSINTIYDEFYKNVNNNFWINYFLNNPMYQKENWIDFESEISDVIQSLDYDMKPFGLDSNIKRISNEFLNKKYYDSRSKLTYKILRNILLEDLDKLIRALEIYLTEYVEKMDIKNFSPDIKDMAIQINPDTHTAFPAKVISFNYTNTFEKIYDKSKSIKPEFPKIF